jgi:hypothetical protein
MRTLKLKGRILLAVVSLCMVVFSMLSMLAGAFVLVVGRLVVTHRGLPASLDEFFLMFGGLLLLTGLAMTVFGIFGYRWRNVRKRARLLFVFGVAAMAVSIFCDFYSAHLEAVLIGSFMQSAAAAFADIPDLPFSFVVKLLGGGPLARTELLVNYILSALYIGGALLNRLAPGTASRRASGTAL